MPLNYAIRPRFSAKWRGGARTGSAWRDTLWQPTLKLAFRMTKYFGLDLSNSNAYC
jgi:hypothetical protein